MKKVSSDLKTLLDSAILIYTFFTADILTQQVLTLKNLSKLACTNQYFI